MYNKVINCKKHVLMKELQADSTANWMWIKNYLVVYYPY